MSPELKKDLEARALRNYHFALDRVGPACPWWAKQGWKYRMQILRIYFKAAVKNHFRFAYGRPGERYHVDHIVALKYKVKGRHVACGLHVPANLHVILAPINLAKGTMLVPEWLDKNSVEDKRKHSEKAQARQEDRERRRRDKLRKRKVKRLAAAERPQRDDDDLMSRMDYAISK